MLWEPRKEPFPLDEVWLWGARVLEWPSSGQTPLKK